MFLTACSVFDANDKGGYASILSPAITYLLLVFVSGIPGVCSSPVAVCNDNHDHMPCVVIVVRLKSDTTRSMASCLNTW